MPNESIEDFEREGDKLADVIEDSVALDDPRRRGTGDKGQLIAAELAVWAPGANACRRSS